MENSPRRPLTDSDMHANYWMRESIFAPKYGRRYGPVFGFIVYIFNIIVRSVALNLRVFIRKNMGARRIYLLSLLIAFIFIRLFFLNEIEYEANHDFSIGQSLGITVFENLTPDSKAFYYRNINYGLQFLSRPPSIEKGAGLDAWFLYVYSFLVLILGVFQFIKVQRNRIRRIHVHRYFSGKSLLFHRFYGERWFGLKLSPQNVWLFEAGFFILGGLALFPLSQSLSWLFVLSGLAHLFEEYQHFAKLRDARESMLDNTLDSDLITDSWPQLSGGENPERRRSAV